MLLTHPSTSADCGRLDYGPSWTYTVACGVPFQQQTRTDPKTQDMQELTAVTTAGSFDCMAML
jgi:hypothetical protein